MLWEQPHPFTTHKPSKPAKDFPSHLPHGNPETYPSSSHKSLPFRSSPITNESRSWKEIDLELFDEGSDTQTEQFSSEKGIVTDRFIPARKHLKLDPTISELE